MKSITNAQQELNALKNDVIGILKYGKGCPFELVLKINEGNKTAETVYITQFGAINRTKFVSYNDSNLKLFPDNKNMNQMLDNPFEFDAFIKSFN